MNLIIDIFLSLLFIIFFNLKEKQLRSFANSRSLVNQSLLNNIYILLL